MAVLAPLLLLALVEAVLRLAGYGYPTRFWLETSDGKAWMPNREFVWQFYGKPASTAPHPCLLLKEKPRDTYRVFVVGESAAVGTPDPSFNFGRILQAMLDHAYPEKRVEVINAAVRGINSHAILQIVRESVRHEADLFIMYMGNNESIGLYSPQPQGLNFTPYLSLLRASQVVKRWKLGQLAAALVVGGDPNELRKQQDAETFRRFRMRPLDRRREAVYHNFQRNLVDMLAAIRAAGAKAILCTVAVNLHDCPPLGSLHRSDLTVEEKKAWDRAYQDGIDSEAAGRPEEAIRHFLDAAEIDDQFAGLQFRLAQGRETTGDHAAAREHYRLARDDDALAFRADRRLNRILRGVAEHSKTLGPGLRLVDIEQVFARSPLSEHGVPGAKLFHEHVHFTFEGDYLIARELFLPVIQALGWAPRLGEDGEPDLLSGAQCAERLAFSAWDRINIAAAMVQFTAHPPFMDQLHHLERQKEAEREIKRQVDHFTPADMNAAIQLYRRAIAARPDDWQLHFNFARLFNDFKQGRRAAAELAIVVRLMPEAAPLRVKYGLALAKVRSWDRAVAEFRTAIELDPQYAEVPPLLNWARRQRTSGTP